MTNSDRRPLPQTMLGLAICLLAIVGLVIASSSGPASGSVVAPTGATGPGPDPDPEIAAKPGKGREGDRGTRVAKVKLRLTAPVVGEGSLRYKLIPGSAKRGKDFKGRGGTVRLREGQTKAILSVKVRGDRKSERKRERLSVKFTRATGVIAARPRTSVTIIDDD